MNDLRTTIIAKSDQLNADDLIGRTMTIKITGVSLKVEEQPVSISFEGDNGKPFKPGKSMRRVLVHAWGPDGSQYVGRSLTLYRDDKVQFGGLAVGGIRISHMSDIKASMTMALTVTRANKKPFTVQPLKIALPQVDQSPSERYPTLFGAMDGNIWLANLEAACDAAQTLGAAVEIAGLSTVTKSLETAPAAVVNRITAALAKATKRLAPGEPVFGAGDEAEPVDNAPEHEAA